MKNLIKALKDIEEQNYKITTTRGSLSLQQTQRNQTKSKILDALYKDLKEELAKEGFEVYITSYGPVIEVLNREVESQVLRMDEDDICTGMISIQVDTVMKNLDVNPSLDEEDYKHQLEQKRIKEKEKRKKREAKIKRDAEERAEKRRQREERLNKLAREKEKREAKEEGENNERTIYRRKENK